MKTFRFDVSTFHQWNYFIFNREKRIRWKIEPASSHFSIVTDLSQSDRKKIFQGFRSLSLFVYPGQTGQISALPDQRKKRNLRKRIEIEEREETTCLESRQPRITTLLLCQDLSPPRIIRSPKSTGPWCRALFPFSLSSSFSSSFLPFTRRHLRRYSSRGNRRSSLRRFNRSTEAIRVKMMRWISER